MDYAKSYADVIEHIMARILNCGRFDVGGLVNSDSICNHPFFSMVSTLMYIYATAQSDKKKKIDKFIDDYFFLCDRTVDCILNFDFNNPINGMNDDFDYSDGIEVLEEMQKRFEEICE